MRVGMIGVLAAIVFGGFFAGAVECPPVISKDLEYLAPLPVKSIKDGVPQGDAATFDLKSKKGKVVVMRLFATWCPYCKEDLKVIEDTMKSLIDEDKIDVTLVVFKSRKETDETLKNFMAVGAQELGLRPASYDWVYSDVQTPAMKEVKDKKGHLLFPNYQGVPYALVFDSKGQLRYRGNFTESKETRKKHYEMIAALSKNQC